MGNKVGSRKPKVWEPLQSAYLPPELQRVAERIGDGRQAIFRNNRYQVCIRDLPDDPIFGQACQLSIKRTDKQPIFDWRDIQRIKNELIGPEVEMVQVFPAESRMVDSANQYWFYAFATYQFPYGFQERLVSEAVSHGTKQRPFEEHADQHPDLGARDEEIQAAINVLHS
jgi:hypothetical protein